jgi:hypothetical protein
VWRVWVFFTLWYEGMLFLWFVVVGVCWGWVCFCVFLKRCFLFFLCVEYGKACTCFVLKFSERQVSEVDNSQ